MDEREDAFGRLLLDFLEGRREPEIVERDDGHVSAHDAVETYFAPVRRWSANERRALRLARGRVLDVGCGAGRVALELEGRAREVVGSTSPRSPSRSRAAAASATPASCASRRSGPSSASLRHDPLLLHNFGLFGSEARARRLLRRLHGLTSERGRILASSNDPLRTDDADHLAYHERNRSRGRPPGQIRLRLRHRTLATPWFDYLSVLREEMAALTDGTGRRLARVVGEPDDRFYVGVLAKDA